MKAISNAAVRCQSVSNGASLLTEQKMDGVKKSDIGCHCQYLSLEGAPALVLDSDLTSTELHQVSFCVSLSRNNGGTA